MTLPASGSISLNQMHIEVGGTSGTTVSINDADIRGLIGKGSGVQMSFNEWYGASAFTADTQIDITSGNSGIKHAVPALSTYTNGLLSGTLGTGHDIRVEPSQGNVVHIHRTSGSALMSISALISYNGSSTPGGGGSNASALSGLYWRTGSIGGSGNPGNHLLQNGTATTSDGGNSSINVFKMNLTTYTTAHLLGTTFGARVQIQIY